MARSRKSGAGAGTFSVSYREVPRHMRRDDGPSEAAIQQRVVRLLRTQGPSDIVFLAVPNEIKRDDWGQFEAMGGLRGAPDLLLIRSGRIYGLELKRASGKSSAAQREVHRHLERAGAFVATAFGLDAAVGYLQAWGLLNRDLAATALAWPSQIGRV